MGGLRLVTQHLDQGRSLAELAAENAISLRCAYRWLARYRSGGTASLADRRSVRRTQRRTLDPQQLQHAVELRHQRLHLRHVARLVQAPSPLLPGCSTVWDSAACAISIPNHQCIGTSGTGRAT